MKKYWFMISLLSIVLVATISLFFKRASAQDFGLYCNRIIGCRGSLGCANGGSIEQCKIVCYDGSSAQCDNS